MAKKYNVGREAEEEALWIYTYSDLISLILGFFIIMFSFSTMEDDKFEEMSKSISETFSGEKTNTESEANVGVINETRQLRALQLLVSVLNIGQDVDDAVKKIESVVEKADDAEAAKQQLMDKLERDPKQPLNALLMTGNQKKDVVVDIVLPNEMLFESGSDLLTPVAKKELKELASILASVKELVEIEVVGHTDSVQPSPKAKYVNNWALSAARAGAVAQELVQGGVDKNIMQSSGLADISPLFPEFEPAGNRSKENMSKNRRVNIVVKKRRHVQ